MTGPALYSADMRFAPEYVANVLNENFEDAKRLFLAPLLAIHQLGNDLVTGGAYGPEAGLIGIAASILGIAFLMSYRAEWRPVL